MNNTDVSLAYQSLQDITHLKLENVFNPDTEITTNIVDMLRNRIRKIDHEDSFNDVLKQMLLDRAPEATWSEIASLLTSREINENIKVKHILEPFIPKEGTNIPLIDNNQKIQDNDVKLNKEASKEVLQAMDALRRIVSEVANRQKLAQEDTALLIAVPNSNDKVTENPI